MLLFFFVKSMFIRVCAFRAPCLCLFLAWLCDSYSIQIAMHILCSSKRKRKCFEKERCILVKLACKDIVCFSVLSTSFLSRSLSCCFSRHFSDSFVFCFYWLLLLLVLLLLLIFILQFSDRFSFFRHSLAACFVYARSFFKLVIPLANNKNVSFALAVQLVKLCRFVHSLSHSALHPYHSTFVPWRFTLFGMFTFSKWIRFAYARTMKNAYKSTAFFWRIFYFEAHSAHPQISSNTKQMHLNRVIDASNGCCMHSVYLRLRESNWNVKWSLSRGKIQLFSFRISTNAFCCCYFVKAPKKTTKKRFL